MLEDISLVLSIINTTILVTIGAISLKKHYGSHSKSVLKQKQLHWIIIKLNKNPMTQFELYSNWSNTDFGEKDEITDPKKIPIKPKSASALNLLITILVESCRIRSIEGKWHSY